MNTKDKIKLKCQEIEDLLIQKNDAYGDSALNPVGIFSSLKASEAIRIRLDDKLKRIANVGVNYETEDTLMDILIRSQSCLRRVNINVIEVQNNVSAMLEKRIIRS